MKKQVVIIHGGDTNDSYEEYLEYLRNETVEKEDLIQGAPKGWKDTLPGILGPDYEVFLPEMPCWMNAKYVEWKIWFEKILPLLHEGPVYIGHSLGGVFLARYFSENEDTKKARGIFLVAPPYGAKPEDHMADFILGKDMCKLSALGNKVHIYASEDDPVVSFADFKTYSLLLPQARTTTFKDKGHFRLNEFPEIVKDIQEAFS